MITLTASEALNASTPLLSLNLVVWSLCIGLILGTVGAFIDRHVVGAFVRKLTTDDVHTPEAAVTLESAGFAKNIFVRNALRDGKALRRLVFCANEEEMPEKSASKAAQKLLSADSAPERVTDLSRARFYIPEETRIRAELRYAERGGSIRLLIASLVLIVLCAVAALHVIPSLIELLDAFLSSIG